MNKSIALIGMPSSGKSTLGPLLAKQLDYSFVDTDQIISSNEGISPKEIVCQKGLEAFLRMQDEVVTKLSPEKLVIATGGGIIHSYSAMEFLRKNTIVVFLDTPIEQILYRVAPDRRFAFTQGKSLVDIHSERYPIYLSNAHITLACANLEPKKILELLTEKLNREVRKIDE